MRWPADLAPGALGQPDERSCGAASVLAARAVLSEWRPRNGDGGAEITEEHRLLTSSRSARDRFQVPWPRALGTPPWAVADALRVLSGRPVATVHARPRPDLAYDVVREQLRTRPVAVYLGSRLLPRHVVLAVGEVGDGIQVFDPSRGARLIRVPRENWAGHRVGVGRWNYFWFAI
ncbi:hypothetical protein ABFU82_13445 [Nocardioides sp. WV_118_6]|uniref:hypothetical protein n=1 Tax=Pimelobacter TaxID=2044 RepID=UPI001C04A2B5|nr:MULTISPECIES: hypothetical protein [Pimelobacter]MBU2696113.1 hypothetical protein [Pimelobacter sp. 30-1]UUW89699.1 hypothetical protein M0M43_28820 [Pimelobacter simplex]UUW93528.1 hypothetical protein M0M48_17475 [Pimelobacter simplex]